MKLMPQEVEVWYLLPALRRELARIFVDDFKLSQKEISKIFNVTESAISQYLRSKRGNEIKFNKEEIGIIKLSAKKMAETRNNEELYKLCLKLRACDSLCKHHKKLDSSLPAKCDLCVG